MCEYAWCQLHKPDFSQLIGPFTWSLLPRPKNYSQMIGWAAKEYERNLRSYYDIDQYWPPKRLGSLESLLRAARSVGVCPDDLAFYINSDLYR